jgi:type IV secretion system protein TrbL
MGIFDGLLNGLGWIWDQTAGRATSAVWDQIVSGLVSWVVNSITWFVAALLQFFDRSSTPALASNWFAGGPIGGNAHSPYSVVASLALSVLVLCVLLSVVHGLLTGEGPAMIGRIARDVPLAVLGIVATIGVVQVLLGTADELATRILAGTEAGAHATTVLRALGRFQASSGQPTFVVFLLGLVAVLGAFVLWVELLVRASLLYVLLALSPFAYAAFVWPSARRILHRLAELIVALVFSKVVIAVALAVAASALASPNTGGAATGDAKIGTLLIGTIMFLLAAFSPFLLLRLFPVVEAAVVAHGISRAPARATQRAMLTALTVTRLAGTGSSGSSSGASAARTRGAPRPAPPAGLSGGAERAAGPGTARRAPGRQPLKRPPPPPARADRDDDDPSAPARPSGTASP